MEKNELKLVLDNLEGMVTELLIKPKSELEYNLFWSMGVELLNVSPTDKELKKIATRTRRDINVLLSSMQAVQEFEEQDKMMSIVGTKSLRQLIAENWPKPPVDHPKCELCGKAR